MAEETPDSSTVQIELDSQAESVALVRAMLAGVAEQLELDRDLLDELNTTVSEACNNVVAHAYGGGSGPLIVQLNADPECVEVTVRDHGSGMEERELADDHLGVGVALITALSDRSEIRTHPDGGTEVRVGFDRRDRHAEHPEWHGSARRTPALDIPGEVVGTLAPVNLLGGVLGRMGRLLAARARFSMERFSDLYMLFDQLAFDAARRARSPGLTFSLSAQTRRLEVEVGPISGAADIPAGTGQADAPDYLRALADEITIEPIDGEHVMKLVVGGTHAHAAHP